MSTNYELLHEYISGLEIVDTHEHLPYCEAARDQEADVLSEYLRHYFSCDLVSAGLTPKQLEYARNPHKPLMERWELIERFWNAARLTGYGRALDLAAKELYGVDRIEGGTLQELNEAFRATLQQDHYHRVLKDICRIKVSILDSNLDCDRTYFRSTIQVNNLIVISTRQAVEALGDETGIPIHTLADLEAAMDTYFDASFRRGAACFKCSLAYMRSLHFPKTCRKDAEEEFNRIFETMRTPMPDQIVRAPALENYLMHHVLRYANRHGRPIQFHTGLQEGNGNYISNSDPSLLTNLFLEYHNAKFDLFHIGYPYEHLISALAKNFRNVFIDFAWAHIISPKAAVNALVEYLDAVPTNKICGFGGDYAFIDGVVGHVLLARRNIANALAEKIEDGMCDLDTAKHLAKMILHDNPIQIFDLKL